MARTRRLGATMTLALGAALACSSGGAPPTGTTTTTPQPTPTTTWTQVWSDEFDGVAGTPVDATKWGFDLGDGCTNGNCGWGNNEKEYYTNAADNVSLNGQGQLAIVARPATGLTCYYGPCRYTSAKITTRGKMSAAPGRVEARIKLPTGQGLWPAFWMLGSGFPGVKWPDAGELDIMENKGSASNISSSAIHGPGYSGNTPIAHANGISQGTLSDGFHVYAVEWDKDHAKFFVDDFVHYSVTRGDLTQYGPSILDQSFFVILNLAVGGNFDGDPKSDAIFPATMLVDYVRVFTATTK
ncbi:MAG TPA: glycoside hydrolase family 16 protein [Gemmatimonadaceae bacterium]|jgi:beta-glucanase (GH16 family)|nr:glycoside hydrolase family 16 protein [Gemmatimonadaceae bacterium]